MNLDNQTMIHIAAEVTLIAGLGFWMKKRADSSDAKIEELEEKMKKYEEVIGQQQNLIARHEAMLRQIFGQPPAPPNQLPPAQKPVQKSSPPKEPGAGEDVDTPSENIDEILKQELAREDEEGIEIETVETSPTVKQEEKKSSPTALKQRKVKKKTENVRRT